MLLPVLSSVATFAIVHAAELNVLRTTTTPNGFNKAARGWNSFAIQSNPETSPTWTAYNQANIISQCDVLATPPFTQSGYTYCSLDSGWSQNGGDDNGRILYDTANFDLPTLADHLHGQGMLLGVYILPGAFCSDANKTILGTDIILEDTFNGNNNGFLRCDFDFTKDGTQQWHNSVVSLFADWGVDFIKLDYVTPGSPDNGGNLSPDTSGGVIAYHKAIAQSGRSMRLDISWKLERNDTYYDIWRANADSMRTDQDINNSGNTTFVTWLHVQREIENYRQYIELQIPKNEPISIYPDLDNLLVGNTASITGVSDKERQTIMTHWIGAAANLIIGSDLTNLDSFGSNLLTNSGAIAIADFCAQFPMQPRNPGSGETSAEQLAAWIAGPSDDGVAVVVLVNYGPDEGSGGFDTSLTGTQTVSITLDDLGIPGKAFTIQDIWNEKNSSISADGTLSYPLGEGESVLLQLTPR